MLTLFGFAFDPIPFGIGIGVAIILILCWKFVFKKKRRPITLDEVKTSMNIAHQHMQLANAELIKLSNVFTELERGQ